MSSERAFWRWFEANEERFRTLSRDEVSGAVDAIVEHVQAYCDQLWALLGRDPDGSCELIITADGNAKYFGAVRRLVSAAPILSGWKFVALKPAQGFGFRGEHDGITFDPAEMWFLPLESAENAASVGIRVAVPGYSDDRRVNFIFGVRIALEMGLGEMAVATKLDYVDVCALPLDPSAAGMLRLTNLPEYLESCERQSGT
ncbi:MAG: hypothetical protein AB1696_00105 [Planctomycetota bacterium]